MFLIYCIANYDDDFCLFSILKESIEYSSSAASLLVVCMSHLHWRHKFLLLPTCRTTRKWRWKLINLSWAHPRARHTALFCLEFNKGILHFVLNKLSLEISSLSEHWNCAPTRSSGELQSSTAAVKRWQEDAGHGIFICRADAGRLQKTEICINMFIGGLVFKVSPNKSSLLGVYFHAVRRNMPINFRFIPAMIYSIEFEDERQNRTRMCFTTRSCFVLLGGSSRRRERV